MPARPRRSPPRNALRVLGSPAVLGADGRPLSPRTAQRHRLALLALLAVARPGGVTRDKLVGMLWPERDERAARHLLSTALYELRQALGAPTIGVVGDEVRLDPARLAVDLHAFDDALARGALAEAVAAYGGPFLDGLFLDDAEEFEGWVSAERARLAHRHEQALRSLADEASRDGRVVEAIGWLGALARARPADGGVARRLVEALAGAGDRAGAIAHAESHAAHLDREFGVAVEPALAAFVRELRAGSAGSAGIERAPERVAGVGAERETATAAAPPAVAAFAPYAPPAPAAPAPAADASTTSDGPRAVASPWGRRIVAGAALAAAAVVLVGAWSLSRRADAGPGAPGRPDVLAVAPLTVVGDVPAEFRDGLADLLSASLGQVEDVRAVPARATAAAYHRLAGDGGAAPAPERLARELGSDGVVTAVVAPAPDGLRISASLVDRDGLVRARAESHGSAADLAALVDRTSVALLRELWGPRWRIPAPRLAAVSTGSAAALRAYLRGEAFLRAARWDSAAVAFAEAADLDSTFALAQLRLAETDGWRHGLGSPSTLRALAAASRHADRLTPRDRGLLAVWRLHEAGDVAALDTARALAERYPSDPDAQFARADTWFHALRLHGAVHAERTAAYFDSAAAVDPSSTRVLAHAVTLGVARDDRARFDRAVARLAATATAERARYHALLRTARWDPPEAALRALAARLREGGLTPPQLGALLAAYAASAVERSPARPDLALALLDSADAASGGDRGARLVVRDRRAELLAASGRLGALRDLLEPAATEGSVGAAAAIAATGTASTLPREWLAGAAARVAADTLATGPARRERAYWGAVLLLGAGDAARARALLRLVDAPPAAGDSLTRALAGASRAAAGVALALDGDTAAAVRAIRAGLAAAGYGDRALDYGAPLRARLASLEASHPATRAAGVDRIRGMMAAGDRPLSGELRRDLARALEALGARGEAAGQWARLAATWSAADPALRPLAEQARERAALLAASSSAPR